MSGKFWGYYYRYFIRKKSDYKYGDYGEKWSISSEVGKLKAVLLRRPAKEVENVTDPAKWRWGSTVDSEKMRWQQ
ncbi:MULTISPECIES: hypothetical protein [unclassified Halanaerobium]|uniref:hypothetical protein n=1 Tax=unclassified Halanaerobium TaxID=2641197 RepID=UPI0018F35600|nr:MULTISPECIES: hypothetical protein [unclassified Halanaerobium]